MGTRIVAGKLRAVAGIKISDFDSAAYLQKHAVPRAKQYVDDFKRSIYMKVQDFLRCETQGHICNLLKRMITIEYTRDYYADYNFSLSDRELELLFSEFFNLFDGYCYSYRYPNGKDKTNKHSAWFDWMLKDHRIRIVDYILHV